MHQEFIDLFVVEANNPVVDQSEIHPNEGDAHNLTCTFSLPTGVSSDILSMTWSRNGSVASNSSRVTIYDTMNSNQFTKTMAIQPVQPADTGDYTCTVMIGDFVTVVNIITVNGKYLP